MIAAALAEAGLKVIVLEAGGLFDESDFDRLRAVGYPSLYWRGGPSPTADMNVTLQAGSTSAAAPRSTGPTACEPSPGCASSGPRTGSTASTGRIRPPSRFRLGAAIGQRPLLGTQRHETSCRTGQAARLVVQDDHRNIDESCYDPATAGLIGFGDQSGAKQSTAKTYLADAVERGADVVVRCFAERVLVEGGRAAGVEARLPRSRDRAHARVTVRAPRVVVACGALESPALLLRSGLGGDAVGKHLRLHPCTAIFAQHTRTSAPGGALRRPASSTSSRTPRTATGS